MAEPITQQIETRTKMVTKPPVDVCLEDVEDCLVYDRHGACLPFRDLYQNSRAVIIFVRSFLCYSCKEYVDDLSRVPRDVLKDAGIRLVVIGQAGHRHIEPFCSLTGYSYEMYVDPSRCIYKKLGMMRGEEFSDSAHPSPHVKSGMLKGYVKSLWRAMTSPAFDFQGDQLQQGGALILGPGSEVHFAHFDSNRLDHMPINWLLQHAGVQQSVELGARPKIIHV